MERKEPAWINLNVSDIRITWISKDGTVIFDNESQAEIMENHLERPEIKAAMETGYGESIRNSSTLFQKQVYYAKLLKDGSVVRVSENQMMAISLFLGLIQPIGFAIVIILIMAFVIASSVSKKIVEPINNINLDNPQETKTYSELQPLLTRLSFQQLHLKKDKEELKKTEQIRQEFTANVSHELKTPLHAISGYAELIQRGLVAEEDIKPFASKIYDESIRLNQVVEDVIDLSRLDAGALNLSGEETDLYWVAENAIQSLESFSQEKGVKLTLSGEHAVFNGVTNLLYSIVYNLCDNAIKYNHKGGEVKVNVRNDEKEVLLTVTDTGIGIPEEHLARIFERFYRVDKSHSKEVGGTGLGLSIVKHAVSIQKGEIKVSSDVGEGTTFTVTFPKA
ncbi:MAG: ATP-binding protein [Lachnospiraceae bacterium]|nr:ATP-binding protein [Lachnospiraceae bacterium]